SVLNENLVAGCNQCLNPCGHQCHTILVCLYFLRNADLHDCSLKNVNVDPTQLRASAASAAPSRPQRLHALACGCEEVAANSCRIVGCNTLDDCQHLIQRTIRNPVKVGRCRTIHPCAHTLHREGKRALHLVPASQELLCGEAFRTHSLELRLHHPRSLLRRLRSSSQVYAVHSNVYME